MISGQLTKTLIIDQCPVALATADLTLGPKVDHLLSDCGWMQKWKPQMGQITVVEGF